MTFDAISGDTSCILLNSFSRYAILTTEISFFRVNWSESFKFLEPAVWKISASVNKYAYASLSCDILTP